MKTRLLPTLVGLALALGVLAPSATAAPDNDARVNDKPVYWLDMYGTPSQHPDRVYFTANAGPYVEDIEWSDWGEQKTVGLGTFGTTSPCDPDGDGPAEGGPPCPDGPSKMVLRKPVKCTPDFGPKKGTKILVYRHGTIWYPDGEGHTVRANVGDRAGWATCRQAY